MDPRQAATFQRDAQRIAAALEAQNTYAQSQQAQKAAADALKAQQDTAKWAGWMLVVAGVETFITAAGVVLVALTLREAKRSANEAKRGADEMKRSADAALAAALSAEKSANSAVASQRPWIKINVRPERLTVTDQYIELQAIGLPENVGNTPATHVFTKAKLAIFADGPFDRDDEIMNELRGDVSRLVMSGAAGRLIFPKDPAIPEPITERILSAEWEQLGIAPEGGYVLILYGIVYYRFAAGVGATPYVMRVWGRNPQTMARQSLNLSCGELDSAQLIREDGNSGFPAA